MILVLRKLADSGHTGGRGKEGRGTTKAWNGKRGKEGRRDLSCFTVIISIHQPSSKVNDKDPFLSQHPSMSRSPIPIPIPFLILFHFLIIYLRSGDSWTMFSSSAKAKLSTQVAASPLQLPTK
eukprot:57032-Hanusia_phi.AAC.1